MSGEMKTCPVCGYELEIDDCEWSEDGAYGYDGQFCPNCDCNVVGDERMNGELKPCPFCGGEARLLHLDYDGNRVWGVFCGNDIDDEYSHGHYIDNYATETEAVNAWNTRVGQTLNEEEHGAD